MQLLHHVGASMHMCPKCGIYIPQEDWQ